MSTYTTQAICLKASPFREADRILVFYSPQRGRISAIAKGVKKPKSKLAGGCEPLLVSELHLLQGKNLDVLCQYQPVEGFLAIRQDILKLSCATLLAEMVYRVATEHDSSSELIYETLLSALRGLESATPETLLPCATRAQQKLLEAEGYAFSVESCVFCQDPLDWHRPVYRFSVEQGGVICGACETLYPTTGNVVPVSTTTLRVFEEGILPETHEDSPWQAAKPLKIQRFLQYYFQQKVEKKLYSAPFLLQLMEEAVVQSATAPAQIPLPMTPVP